MKIIDGDSGDAVERFPVSMISQPTAFNHQNHIYDNILIFTVQHPEETTGKGMEPLLVAFTGAEAGTFFVLLLVIQSPAWIHSLIVESLKGKTFSSSIRFISISTL